MSSSSFEKAHDENIAMNEMTAVQLADKPEGYFPVTQEEKNMSRKINRKLDICILPFLSLLYLFSGLDRGTRLEVVTLIQEMSGTLKLLDLQMTSVSHRTG